MLQLHRFVQNNQPTTANHETIDYPPKYPQQRYFRHGHKREKFKAQIPAFASFVCNFAV